MLKKIEFNIKNIKSENCKYLLETEIDVLKGVKNVSADYKTGKCEVEYDDEKIALKDLFKAVKNLGYELELSDYSDKPGINESVYYVSGMHCASCEVLIENKLLKENKIKSVEAAANKGEVVIEYEGVGLKVENLNKLFKKDGYRFFSHPTGNGNGLSSVKNNKSGKFIIDRHRFNNPLVISGFSLLFIIVFFVLNKSGISAYVSVNAKSALPMFMIFGLLAGFSSCAALVGGIILSMSKQWLEIYSAKDSNFRKLQPHILFNVGRLISYAGLGAVLGGIGGIFQFSTNFSSMLVIAVSVIMIFLGLQMLGVKYFQKFQITMPRFVTRYMADEANFKGRYMPLIMGAATFFLPCGFTITAQGLALTSGSVWQGSLIMLFFALGTLIPLLAIGLSSVTFSRNPRTANRFLKIAGVVVLFFAIFNMNSQLNVLGLSSLDDISFSSNKTAIASEEGFPEIVGGKQILKMDAFSYAYEPRNLKVRAGVPVRWEINDKGTSGCTNAIMSKGLFSGQIDLTPGKVSIKEFTPEKAGRYKFSCWMGMISGVIDVVDVSDDGQSIPLTDGLEIIDSGAKGCGCGGAGSGTCGG